MKKLLEILTGTDEAKEYKTVGYLFAIVLLIGIGVAGFSLYKNFQWTEYYIEPEKTLNLSSMEDKQRLTEMTNRIKSVIEIRGKSVSVADIVLVSTRYPFGEPVKEVPREVVAIKPNGNKPVVIEPKIEKVIETPPDIVIKGIMGIGGNMVALLDIANELPSQIYHVNSFFAMKDGKILKIERDKITVRYKGNNFDFTFPN